MSRWRDSYELARQGPRPGSGPEDAAATAEALGGIEPGDVVIVYVVEKAGGSIDKASVEQREMEAEEAFAAFRDQFPDADTEIRYGTAVTDEVFTAAADQRATAVAILPRRGGRLIRFLSGDHALKLVTENDVPVISLPTP